MSDYLPLVIVEGVMVFGGALLFGWWQLRSVRRDREKAAQKAQREAADERRQNEAATASSLSLMPANRSQTAEVSDPPP